MPRRAYLTPVAAAGDYLCRRLRIPVELVPAVNGALLELINDWNWEARESMTVDEAITLCDTMIDEFWNSGDACMIGSIQPYVTGTLPDGVLPCDGSTFDRVDYPVLYDLIDASLVDDPDTFHTPDLRGRAIIGTGTGSGLTARAFGDVPGSETHQLTESEMPSHNHSYLPPAINPDVEGPGIPDIGATVIGASALTGSAGGDNAHNNMQPSHALTWGLIAK